MAFLAMRRLRIREDTLRLIAEVDEIEAVTNHDVIAF